MLFLFRRKNNTFVAGQSTFITISASCIFILYVLVKVLYSSGLSPHVIRGTEDELVINYFLTNNSPVFIITVIEDVFSNFITYIYLAFTNFLPPLLFISNVLLLGKNTIVNNQFGHAESYGSADFVYFHYLFLWYMFAGILFTVFCYFLIKYLLKLFRDTNQQNAIVFAFLLFIATGCLILTLMKYRFYLSLPIYEYKCVLSVTGVALLLSYLLAKLRGKIRSEKRYYAVLSVLWAVIIITAFVKPIALSYYASLMKMPQYPLAIEELLNIDIMKLLLQ